MDSTKTGLLWNAGGWNKTSDFSESGNEHNINYPLSVDTLKEKTYITVTLDTSESYEVEGKEGEYYKQVMYINGIKLYEGDYNKANWEGFIKEKINSLSFFCVGRSSMSSDGTWCYSKMSAKCLRLYHRALSETEVMKNYEKTKEYHR